jgi:predicted enzyme related to lactoylglutathione lyase
MASPPVYYQLATSDPARARAFLGELFEWPEGEDDALAIQPGGPADFDVAGQITPEREGGQQITPYFRVGDLAATVALAEERGATIVMPVTQVPQRPHIAMIRTPDDELSVGIVQA